MCAKIFEQYRSKIHGMIHCSGGAQTKILHFIDGLHVVKDNMFKCPPLFKMIQVTLPSLLHSQSVHHTSAANGSVELCAYFSNTSSYICCPQIV